MENITSTLPDENLIANSTIQNSIANMTTAVPLLFESTGAADLFETEETTRVPIQDLNFDDSVANFTEKSETLEALPSSTTQIPIDTTIEQILVFEEVASGQLPDIAESNASNSTFITFPPEFDRETAVETEELFEDKTQPAEIDTTLVFDTTSGPEVELETSPNTSLEITTQILTTRGVQFPDTSPEIQVQTTDFPETIQVDTTADLTLPPSITENSSFGAATTELSEFEFIDTTVSEVFETTEAAKITTIMSNTSATTAAISSQTTSTIASPTTLNLNSTTQSDFNSTLVPKLAGDQNATESDSGANIGVIVGASVGGFVLLLLLILLIVYLVRRVKSKKRFQGEYKPDVMEKEHGVGYKADTLVNVIQPPPPERLI